MTVLIGYTINFLYYAIFILLLARMVLSLANIGPYELREWVFRLTEPLLAPIRRLLPSSGGLDLSPMVLLFGLYLLRQVLFGVLV